MEKRLAWTGVLVAPLTISMLSTSLPKFAGLLILAANVAQDPSNSNLLNLVGFFFLGSIMLLCPIIGWLAY